MLEPLEPRALLSAAPVSAPLSPGDASVVARHVFYNRSAFDGRSPRADPRDDAAVAPDKSPLLPGQSPTEAQYTSYTRGINGLMVDVAGLPTETILHADDFAFTVGNNGQPTSWKAAPAPKTISVRPSPGLGGAARITITWRDGAIRNTWLRVAVSANANTGLAAQDVFYVGNLVGSTAEALGGPVARVTDEDVSFAGGNLARDRPPDDPADFDRNGRVTRADARAPRRNLGAELYAAGPFSDPSAAAMGADLPGDWKLVFRDEFSGDLPDPVWRTTQYWEHEVTVVGDGELQAYAPSGVSVGGGMLRLTARRDDTYGVPYTSGLVMSGGERAPPASPRFNFLYGYIEVRAKVPSGAGLWPAVWMMPASYRDDMGELDVVEIRGDEPARAQFTAHRRGRQDSHVWDGYDLSQDFHTYGMEWRSDYVAWFVDGVERARTDAPNLIAHEPMYPLLNLAVGGDYAGPPDATTPFPATLEVDYVRVWQSA
jgi:beta-glucanase (GH16 family)